MTGLSSSPAEVSRYSDAWAPCGCRRSITPASCNSFRRFDRSAREISGTPRWISLKRELPLISSRRISGVHRVVTTSAAFATGQNCPYSVVLVMRVRASNSAFSRDEV